MLTDGLLGNESDELILKYGFSSYAFSNSWVCTEAM